MPDDDLDAPADPDRLPPLVALRSMRRQLWDPERGMDRFAPGVAPGVDLAALNLHATRETALGAFADLGVGDVDRAVPALRSVLALQYPVDGAPWGGSFPVAAETPEPPGTDAVEWVHYDPNWRQFVGCALAMCRLVHGDALPDDVVDGIARAVAACVAGEPEARIARWYTNPNLMHAWLQGQAGVAGADDELIGRAHQRLAMLVSRVQRYGDLDEYNSPTYDGIDLWAIGLWATHPPTPAFTDAVATILPLVGERISALYHPGLGVGCGPYLRTYGLDPTRYVSLSGLLFAGLGEPVDRVLPSPLTPHTDHVHDLYFAPVLDHVAPALRPHLRVAPVTGERHRVQRFRTAVAEHLLRPDLALGWDRGRRHEASLDQYAPFTAHAAEPDGTVLAFGVMVPPETAWVDVERTGDLEFRVTADGRADVVGLRVVGNRDATATVDARTVTVRGRAARVELLAGAPPTSTETVATPAAHELHLTWPGAQLDATIRVSVRR